MSFEAVPKNSERWSWGDVGWQTVPKAASGHWKRCVQKAQKIVLVSKSLKDYAASWPGTFGTCCALSAELRSINYRPTAVSI